MNERSNAKWFVAIAVTALVAVGGTWLVMDRSTDDELGDPVAAVDDSATTVADPTGESDSDTPSWLFSQTAHAGTFSTDADGVSTLTLTDVDPGVIGFTDRPDRDTVVIEVASFVEAWPTMFADAAPNAVLVEHQPDGGSDSFVVELSDPRLDGTSLSFTAKVIDGEDHSGIAGVTEAPHTNPPATFEVVSLFIDNVLPQKWICMKDGREIDPPAPIPYPGSQSAAAAFELQCWAAGGDPTYPAN